MSQQSQPLDHDEPGTEIKPFQGDTNGYGAIAALNRAEIDIQISTAKAYPRSIARFTKRSMELACLNPEIAESCFYSLKRGGKPIEGPSVRLAEIAASCYGNLAIEARIIGEDRRFVTAQACAYDLENNIRIRVEKRRRITDKAGNTYNDDMIAVTANAAASIAFRDAVLRIIPQAFIQPIYEEARQAAIGKAETLAGRRAKALQHFAKMGVDEPRLLAALADQGVRGVEDITGEILLQLKGMAQAIRDGVDGATVDSLFPPLEAPTAAKTEAVADKLRAKAAETPAENQEAEPLSAVEVVELAITSALNLKSLDAAYRDVHRLKATAKPADLERLNQLYATRKNEISGE